MDINKNMHFTNVCSVFYEKLNYCVWQIQYIRYSKFVANYFERNMDLFWKGQIIKKFF